MRSKLTEFIAAAFLAGSKIKGSKHTSPQRRNILLVLLLAFAASVSVADVVIAGCRDGVEAPCQISGQPGTRVCAGGHFAVCEPIEPLSAKSGQVQPKYYILAVVYSPPGTTGGLSASSVTYGSGSTWGTTVSASSSFKQDYSTSVSTGGGILGSGVEVGLSWGYTQSTSDSESLDINSSTSREITFSGPSNDGIDHDHDLIILWLNPTVYLQLTPKSAAWNLANNRQADIQYVYAGWLKDQSKIPAGLLERFQTYGITAQDFAEMLKADPFASGTATLNAERFQDVNTTFPYEPPLESGGPVPLFKYTQEYSSTGTRSSSLQYEYTVGVSASGSGDFLTLFKASLKEQASWTWTNTDTRSTSVSTSESASVTISGPSYGYSGPTDISVYYDVIYKTFLFQPVTGALPKLRGLVTSSSNQAVNGKVVDLIANGVHYRTFTNMKGEYRFYGNISGRFQLSVEGVQINVPQTQVPEAPTIVVP